MSIKERVNNLHPQLKQLVDFSQSKICLPYQPNQDRLRKVAQEINLSPAKNDQIKVCRIHVDEQTCFNWPLTYMTSPGEIRYLCFIESKDSFIFPSSMETKVDWVSRDTFNPLDYDQIWGGQLSVPNSWNDTLRVVECDIVNLHRTTKHVLSADKHPALSVTNQYNYVANRNGTYSGTYYKKGDSALVFTVILPQSLFHSQHNPGGFWIPQCHEDQAWNYIVKLTKSQLKVDPAEVLPLTLWPIHATQETWGSLIDPLIWEIVQLHAYARNTDWHLIEKGQSPATEFHGAYESEVVIKNDPYSQPKISELNYYDDFDLLVYSGQAAGNCFRRTIEQQFDYLSKIDFNAIKKMIVLSDATSFITGTQDGYYRSLEKMKTQGLRVMTIDQYTQELDRLEAIYSEINRKIKYERRGIKHETN